MKSGSVTFVWRPTQTIRDGQRALSLWEKIVPLGTFECEDAGPALHQLTLNGRPSLADAVVA
jgi:hypothetical protein